MCLFCWIPMDCVVTWQLLHKQVRVNPTWPVNFSRAFCNLGEPSWFLIQILITYRFERKQVKKNVPITMRREQALPMMSRSIVFRGFRAGVLRMNSLVMCALLPYALLT